MLIPQKHFLTRFSRFFINNFLGGEVRNTGAQGSDDFENHGGGFDAILPCDSLLPLCCRDDPESRTGKPASFSLWTTATNILYAFLSRNQYNWFQLRELSQTFPEHTHPHLYFLHHD